MAKRLAVTSRSMSTTYSSPRPNASPASEIMATTSASARLARTTSIIRTFSLCSGLWMPGVSRNAIWPRSSLRMPTMRLRVVCGLAETMETLRPRMRFSSVDLPALGRPTMATMPDFFSSLTLPLRIGGHAHAVDAPAVGAGDGELESVLAHLVADLRDASERGEDQARHGLVVVARQLGVEHLLQVVDAKQAADQILAAADVDDRDLLLLVQIGRASCRG